MCPESIEMQLSRHDMLAIDDKLVHPEGTDRAELVLTHGDLELDDVRVFLSLDGREVEITIGNDRAVTLGEALIFFAAARRRQMALRREEREYDEQMEREVEATVDR
jgi:hypothetical protein